MNTNLLRLGSKMASRGRAPRSPGPVGLSPLPPTSARPEGLGYWARNPAPTICGLRTFSSSLPQSPLTCYSKPFSRLSSVFKLLKFLRPQTLHSPKSEFKLVETWEKVYVAHVCLSFLPVPISAFYCP